MACNHPADRVIQETGFCFACWRAEKDRQRAEKRAALESAIAAGCVILEGGRTQWIVDGGIIKARWRPDDRFHIAFVNIPADQTVAYLAEHLENRSYGFGWELSIQPEGMP